MSDPVLATPERWPVIALFSSLVMLAAAHGFERFGGLAPCALCHTQREVYWGAAALAAAALLAGRFWSQAWAARAFNLLLGVAFLAGAVVAAYHVGVENKWWPGPAVCAGGGSGLDGLTPESLTEALTGAVTVVRCDAVAWSFLGLSMAGWNAAASLVLAGLSVLAASRTQET
jgi:disulfide bond formation protein DsbB